MLQSLYVSLFLLISVFCYVSPIFQGLDTKPFYLLLSIPLAIIGLRKVNKFNVIFIFIAVYSLLFFIAYAPLGLNYRGPVQYIGFLLLFFAFKYVYEYEPEKPILFIKVFVFTYFLAGLVQMVLGPEILSSLISVRTTDDRGVTALTPEPAVYGLMLLGAGLILFLKRAVVSKVWFFLIFIQLFMFSQSALAILVFVLIMGTWFLCFRFRYLVLALSLITAYIVFYGLESEGSGRIFRLLNKLAENPSAILMVDASINERVAHIVLPIYGLFTNFGVPGGFHSFMGILAQRSEIFNGLFWWGAPSNVIMSGFSSVLYEMGLAGVLFIVASVGVVFSNKWLCIKDKLFISASMFLIMFQAIPILNPIFPWLLCAAIYYRDSKCK
ncbi:hypothetical protein N473_05585 [Pseudoalteromonas luteoviolacea CPMOR-1]|uniref:O-antigen polymerase n=1 Tax=Pseudoalteromonas luteoviolacea CPMOR-1 TaxID=1365248 RepID=A0A161YDQ1_9GAMM|nr:PEP-CTERM sorting domain-containing protein [Pseudoalteromonas luteoviolacea]KZN58214.1 hypothetical protein N473_05585 [Pseudoalteromonas luteoviolacea CPMOR-1]